MSIFKFYKFIFRAVALGTLCLTCTYERREGHQQQLTDTTIVKVDITEELAGSAYRIRATGYQLVMNQDTSQYMPVFMELSDSGKVVLDLNMRTAHLVTFAEVMIHLEKVLPRVSSDYNLRMLRNVYLGRLVNTGRMALQITHEYQETNLPETIYTRDYTEIGEFLKNSTLGEKFGELFRPYEVGLADVSIEKAFFLTVSSEDTSQVTNQQRILDCIVYLNFQSDDARSFTE